MYRNNDELAAELALELQQQFPTSLQDYERAMQIARTSVQYLVRATPRKTFSQVLREMNDWETDEHGSKKCPSCQQTLYWQRLSLKPRYIHALRILDRENIPLTFKQLSQFARSEPKGATYYRYFTELRHWGFVRGTGELLDRAEKYEITPDGMRFVRGEIAAWQWVWKLKGKDLAMPQPYADTQPAPMVRAGDVLEAGDTPDEDNDREGHLRRAQSVREGTINPYGYCPKCGKPGVSRERRPNGDDLCMSGHKYPSIDAMPLPPATVPIREAGKPAGLRSVPVHADRPCIDQHGPYEQCMRCDPQVQAGMETLDRIAEAGARASGLKPVDGVTTTEPGGHCGAPTVVMHRLKDASPEDRERVRQALLETHLCVCSAVATHHYVGGSGILMHQCQACFLRDA